MANPSTYQERREAKKFIEQRIRELSLSSYDIRRSEKLNMPANIRAAKKTVDQWEKMVDRKASTAANSFSKQFNPVREMLILGNFEGALLKIKSLEKSRAAIMAKFKV